MHRDESWMNESPLWGLSKCGAFHVNNLSGLTGMEEELADYNGDDENEGEFEADKQAELAQN